MRHLRTVDHIFLLVVYGLLLGAVVIAALVNEDSHRTPTARTATPVPTLERPSRPTPSSRGDRPAVLVAPLLGKATATALPTAVPTPTKVPTPTPVLVSLGVFKTTSYCLSGITRSGEPVRPGAVAVDPTIIRLHSLLSIDGLDGVYTALDTGSGIKDRWLDIWKPSCSESLQWGVRHRVVWQVLEGAR